MLYWNRCYDITEQIIRGDVSYTVEKGNHLFLFSKQPVIDPPCKVCIFGKEFYVKTELLPYIPVRSYYFTMEYAKTYEVISDDTICEC